VKAAQDRLFKVETKEGCCVSLLYMSVKTVLRQCNLKFRPKKRG